MKYIKHISSLLFLFLTTFSSSQTQLLKKYDFNKGGYYLIGIRSESDRNGLADSLGEFYTDDIKVLNAIKKEWTFKKPSPQYACGYHYTIVICKDGLEVESFSINLNCNEIASDQGYFYFKTQQLRMFKNNFKKPFIKSEKFKSIIDARNYRNKILNDTNLILTETPNWISYEGTFKFTYVCQKGNKDCLNNETLLLKKLTEEIKKHYPNEQFKLEGRGGSTTELFVEVKSNKSLADKFNLYKRDVEYDKWEPYSLWLYTYWIVKQKMVKN